MIIILFQIFQEKLSIHDTHSVKQSYLTTQTTIESSDTKQECHYEV